MAGGGYTRATNTRTTWPGATADPLLSSKQGPFHRNVSRQHEGCFVPSSQPLQAQAPWISPHLTRARGTALSPHSPPPWRHRGALLALCTCTFGTRQSWAGPRAPGHRGCGGDVPCPTERLSSGHPADAVGHVQPGPDPLLHPAVPALHRVSATAQGQPTHWPEVTQGSTSPCDRGARKASGWRTVPQLEPRTGRQPQSMAPGPGRPQSGCLVAALGCSSTAPGPWPLAGWGPFGKRFN